MASPRTLVQSDPAGFAAPSREGLNATKVESLWGRVAKAKGDGSLGLSAALWDTGVHARKEIVRDACDKTHVISIWHSGSANSTLFIDGKVRFQRLRRRGSFQLARAGESVRAHLTDTSGACLDLYLPVGLTDTCIEAEIDGGRGPLEFLPLGLEEDPMVTRVGDHIAAEIQQAGLASRMAIDSATLMLAVNLVRNWSNQSNRLRLPSGGLAPWQVRRATEFLRDNLAEDVSLATLAGQTRLSPFHFARAFKVSVGRPPHAYQRDLRIERAKILLVDTDLSVTEIAAQVGYDSPNSLARVFQRALAVSPSRYRRDRRP